MSTSFMGRFLISILCLSCGVHVRSLIQQVNVARCVQSNHCNKRYINRELAFKLDMKVQSSPMPAQNTKLLAPQLLKSAVRMLQSSQLVQKLLAITPPTLKSFLTSIYPAELFFLIAFRLSFQRLLRFAYRTQALLWKLLQFDEPKDWEHSILGFVAGQCDRLAQAMSGIYMFKVSLLVLVQLGLRVPSGFPHLVSRIVYLIYWGRFIDEFKSRFLCTFYPGLALPDSKRQRHMVNQSTTFAISTIGVLILSQMLSNFFQTPLSSILALGGVGGIAVGLSARDVVANFLGGLMLLFNDPFAPSDMVTFKIGGTEVLGRVDRIGWTQTRIKTRETKSMYIPNSHFVQTPVMNNDRITHRKYESTVSIRLQDASRVDKVVSRIRERISNIPKLDKMSMPFRVHFAQINQFSLDIHMVVYFGIKSLDEYLQLQQTTNLEVISAIQECGAQLAVPTTMLHLAGVSSDTTTLQQAVPTAQAVASKLVQSTNISDNSESNRFVRRVPESEDIIKESTFNRLEQADQGVQSSIVGSNEDHIPSPINNQDLSTHNMFQTVTSRVSDDQYDDVTEREGGIDPEQYQNDERAGVQSKKFIDYRDYRIQGASSSFPSYTSQKGMIRASNTLQRKDAEQIYSDASVWGDTLRRSGIMPNAHKIVPSHSAEIYDDSLQRDSLEDLKISEFSDSDLSRDDLDVLLDDDDDDVVLVDEVSNDSEVAIIGTPTAFWEDADSNEKKVVANANELASTERSNEEESVQGNDMSHGKEDESVSTVQLGGLTEHGGIIVEKFSDVTDEDDLAPDDISTNLQSTLISSSKLEQRMLGDLNDDIDERNEKDYSPPPESSDEDDISTTL